MKNERIGKKKDQQREDYLATRVMAVFVVAFVLLLGLSYLWNGYNSRLTIRYAIRANDMLTGVSAALLFAGVIWAIADKKRGRDISQTVINGGFLIFAALTALIASILTRFDADFAQKALYIIIPAAAILHLVYCSYQREFFMLCMTYIPSVACIWLIAKNSNQRIVTYAAIFSLVFCAVALLAFFSSKKNGGYIGKIRVLDNLSIKTSLVCLIYGALALLTLMAFFVGAPYAYYFVYALVTVFVLIAVFFTVKLI